MSIPVYPLDLPEYSIARKPDYAALGPFIDRFIVECFAGRRIALRAVFLDDHPGPCPPKSRAAMPSNIPTTNKLLCWAW